MTKNVTKKNTRATDAQDPPANGVGERPTTSTGRLLTLLREYGPQSAQEAVEALGGAHTLNTIRDALYTLEKAGKVRKTPVRFEIVKGARNARGLKAKVAKASKAAGGQG